MVTVHHLRIYKTVLARGGQRAYTGPAWAVAGPSGAVLVYCATYPSSELIEDILYALNFT